MGLFQWLFKKTEDSKKSVEKSADNVLSTTNEDKWQTLPGYVPAEKNESQLVSLIASAIAAGENPKSQFIVKKVLKRNPEVLQVSLIASSMIQTTDQNAQLIIKKISRKLEN